MMNDNTAGLTMCTVDDDLMTVFYFDRGTATICTIDDEPKLIELKTIEL